MKITITWSQVDQKYGINIADNKGKTLRQIAQQKTKPTKERAKYLAQKYIKSTQVNGP